MSLCIEHTLLTYFVGVTDRATVKRRLWVGEFAKSVKVCFACAVLSWMAFDLSMPEFIWLSIASVLLPLVYYLLAGRLGDSRSESRSVKLKRLEVELLKGVIYQPPPRRQLLDSETREYPRQKK